MNNTIDRIKTPIINGILDLYSNDNRQYSIIFHNDDVTPMDFVALTLVVIFEKSPDDAVDLTFKIHNEGSAIVYVCSMDEAYARVEALDRMKQDFKQTLLVTVEETE